MKKGMRIGVAVLCFVTLGSAMAQSRHDRYRDRDRDWDRHERHDIHLDDSHSFSLDRGFTGVDDVRIRVRPYEVRITPEDWDSRGRVVITEEYALIINGDEVKLGRGEKELVKKYFEMSQDIIDQAKAIGYEGARVGVEGAKLGLKALAGVFRLLDPEYSSDDLERDMERESKKIERKAERLEDEAEKIEDRVDDLQDVHRQLRRKVDQLAKLEWF